MRVALVGRHATDIRDAVERHGFEIVLPDENPDVIIAYGGDGTFIGAEAEWPGVPKLGLRSSRSCVKCGQHEDEDVLGRLARGDVSRTELMKLRAEMGSRAFLGLNDVILRNSDLRSAVRFSVLVNGERATDEIIGDGLVVATPFGSSAYFRSIANTTFRCGIGIAFNNCTEFLHHLVLREDDEVVVEISRGPADVTADNDPSVARAEGGDNLCIRRSGERATVLALDTLRCPFCRYKHAPRRRF